MRVLITGGTGFIGSELSRALLARGTELIVLSRAFREDLPQLRFVQSLDEIPASEPLDAVINLAGASLAARRWTNDYKHQIVASRMDITRALVALLARLDKPPKALLSASAIGFYGHHGNEQLTENSAVTKGFAQKLCSDWESLALEAHQSGVRVCLLRLGVVLDQDGGALEEMAKSFRFGVASWLGAGSQWLSWVHREDVIRAIEFLLGRDDLQGPYNITSPFPVTGRTFCSALQAHHRTFFRTGVPAPILRVLVGEMAEELLLNGQRVLPCRLQEEGFEFSYPNIESALDAIYGPQTTLRTRNSSG